MAAYRVDVCSSENEAVKRLEYEVFLRAGYIEPNEDQEVLENRKYAESRFVVVWDDERDTVAGSFRIIVDHFSSVNEVHLPALSSFEIWPWMRHYIKRISGNKVMQAGSMVIHESARSGKVLTLILQKIIELALQEGIRYGVSSIDDRFYRVLKKMGYPIRQIGDKKHYMGSVTVPVLIDAVELCEQRSGMMAMPALAQAAS